MSWSAYVLSLEALVTDNYCQKLTHQTASAAPRPSGARWAHRGRRALRLNAWTCNGSAAASPAARGRSGRTSEAIDATIQKQFFGFIFWGFFWSDLGTYLMVRGAERSRAELGPFSASGDPSGSAPARSGSEDSGAASPGARGCHRCPRGSQPRSPWASIYLERN